jgi:hypothetical protein
MMPMKISRNLNTNVKTKFNNIMAKEMDKFNYLGSEKNSKGKTDTSDQ